MDKKVGRVTFEAMNVAQIKQVSDSMSDFCQFIGNNF